MEPPGRIHQDDNFDVIGYEGEVIEKLVGVLDQDAPDNQPTLIYLKTKNRTWQKYFLDAGLGFWEDWGDIEYDDDDKIIDYGAMFNLTGHLIKSITCRDGNIVIEFDNGDKFILQLIDPEKDDTAGEVILIRQNT